MTNKDYERLTVFNEELQRPCMTAEEGEQTTDTIARHVQRLYELENAIEDGTLKFVPYKTGDTVWLVNWMSPPSVEEGKIIHAVALLFEAAYVVQLKSGGLVQTSAGRLFKSEEEAERALKELSEGKYERKNGERI